MNIFMDEENIYGAHNYHPFPVVLKRGVGVYVWDINGKRYLDMMSAYSAVSHGHCHPLLVRALTDQAHHLAMVSRAFHTDKLGPFLKRICEVTGQQKALPMNTGAEAVETAIKASRKWGYKIKKIPNGKAEIIACKGNFHGRTTTIVGLSTEPQYREGFGPFPSGLKTVPYGKVQALEEAITPNTAAFFVEPIQGEGGINVPPKGYLKACADICKQNGVLFICDEVQTGLGRTGKLLACEHENVKPDGLILGKALGGGLLPVSLFLSNAEVMGVFTPGDHGSTFGGNPLAAAVGLAAINVLFDEGLIKRAAELGAYFFSRLQAIQSPLIKEVRGQGLLIGVEIDAKYSAHELCLRLIERGLLTKETHRTVLRFAPPLVITKEQINEALDILVSVLKESEAEVLSG